MGSKWGRRYKRHRDKHAAYFEALAREIIERQSMKVDLGVAVVEVRLGRFRRRLEFIEPDGSVSERTNVRDFRGDDLVHVIADYLMRWAAHFPGVEIPPP